MDELVLEAELIYLQPADMLVIKICFLFSVLIRSDNVTLSSFITTKKRVLIGII